MNYSEAGMTLTGDFEGLRLVAYRDAAGVWTIGYGHTGPEVQAGETITADQAKALLIADLHAAVAVVNRSVRVVLSQTQFDALVDFVFNMGVGRFIKSDLLKLLNAGDYEGAAGQLALWVHGGGKVLPGLVKRRAAEIALFRG